MIEYVELKDFQKHRKRKAAFGPGVNCLVGETEAGKSALVRAIWWALTNRPTGSSFVRLGGQLCEVTVTLEGVAVTRSRGKGINSYYLGEEEFHAFGQGVPEQVSRLTNVEAFNFQGQHDPAFWISLPPSQASQELNRIVNLQAIDRTLAAADRAARRAKASYRECKLRHAQAREKRKSLAWVAGAVSLAEEITALRAELDGLERRSAALTSLVDEGEAAGTAAGAALPSLKPLQAGFARLTDLEARRGQILTLVDEAEVAWRNLQSARTSLSAAEKEMNESGTKCPLCGAPSTRRSSSPTST